MGINIMEECMKAPTNKLKDVVDNAGDSRVIEDALQN